MFPRKIELYLDSLADKYRLITLLGPRQSGKTTLARHYFKGYLAIPWLTDKFELPDPGGVYPPAPHKAIDKPLK